MKCPVCNEEAKDDLYCEKCNKNLVDIYLKMIEEMQVKREYDEALKIIENMKLIIKDETILKELKEIEEAILFSKIEIKTKEKKRKNFLIIIILFIIILGIIVGGLVIYNKLQLSKNVDKVEKLEEFEKNDDKKRFSKFIFDDIAKLLVSYKEGIEYKDINGDGENELVVVFGMNYFVLSPDNDGNIVYWYDLLNNKKVFGSDFEIYNKKTFIKEKTYLNNQEVSIENNKADYNITSSSSITFESDFMVKNITFSEKGVEIEYFKKNNSKIEILIPVEVDLAPMYSNLGEILIENIENGLKILNTSSNYGINLYLTPVEIEKNILTLKNRKILKLNFLDEKFKIRIEKSE